LDAESLPTRKRAGTPEGDVPNWRRRESCPVGDRPATYLDHALLQLQEYHWNCPQAPRVSLQAPAGDRPATYPA
jgi:hypothetical protein